MRACPTCGRQFSDDLKFCLEDGSALVDVLDEVETRFVRASPPNRGRSGILTVAVTVVLLLGAGLVLAGATVGGYLYFASRQTHWTPTPTPSPARNTYPTPTAVPSPTATPRLMQTPSKSIEDDLRTVDPSGESNKKPVPKQISGGVLNGKATSLPKPPYPPAARAVRASGAVSVQVLVDENGSVISASAVSGHPLLRPAAVQAARGARFAPTMLSGQAVKVSGVITYNFIPPD